MKLHNKRKKTYYIGLNKLSNTIFITTTRTGLSSFIGISVDTIRRHLIDSPIYDTKEFTVWSDISIDTAKKGFAL